jgi:hypothetical protein
MNTLANHMDDMDLLVRTARSTGMQPEKFAAGMLDAMQRVSALLSEGPPPPGFLDADALLSEALNQYETKPSLAGVGRIGNALVSYRRTAIARST